VTVGHIVHVCDFSNQGAGNFIPSQLVVALLARQELGLNTHFVFPREVHGAPWIDDLARHGMGVSLIDRARPRHERARWLGRRLAEHHASLVHSHFTRFDLECAWAGRTAGARTVWHLHSGIASYTPRRRASDVVKVRVVGRRFCDRVVACAPWIAEQAVRRGFAGEQVRLVPNGIVLERFRADQLPDTLAARSLFGFDPDAFVVLAFCWDPARKGADLILDATSRVVSELDRSLLLVMVGGEELDLYVERWLGGVHPPWLKVIPPVDDAPALLRAADIFVNASRREGMAYAIAEAMAAERVVIASDIPGSKMYAAAPAITLFPSEDRDALHVALRGAGSGPPSEELGRRNREFAFEHFGADRYASDIVDVYRELLHGDPSRPSAAEGRPAAPSDAAPAALRAPHSKEGGNA
jgi:glycosyltransferase involved in cell wall biosynthesis